MGGGLLKELYFCPSRPKIHTALPHSTAQLSRPDLFFVAVSLSLTGPLPMPTL